MVIVTIHRSVWPNLLLCSNQILLKLVVIITIQRGQFCYCVDAPSRNLNKITDFLEIEGQYLRDKSCSFSLKSRYIQHRNRNIWQKTKKCALKNKSSTHALGCKITLGVHFELLCEIFEAFKGSLFLGGTIWSFLTKKVWAVCNCRMTMRVGAFERSSIGEGFYFLFCGHTTHRNFFRSKRSY